MAHHVIQHSATLQFPVPKPGHVRTGVFLGLLRQERLTNRTFVLMTASSGLKLDEPGDNLPPSVAHEKLTLAEQMRAALRSRSSDQIR